MARSFLAKTQYILQKTPFKQLLSEQNAVYPARIFFQNAVYASCHSYTVVGSARGVQNAQNTAFCHFFKLVRIIFLNERLTRLMAVKLAFSSS